MIAKEYLSYHELKKISTVKPSLYSQFHTEHLRPSWTVRARLVNFRVPRPVFTWPPFRLSTAPFRFPRSRRRDLATREPVELLRPAWRLCLRPSACRGAVRRRRPLLLPQPAGSQWVRSSPLQVCNLVIRLIGWGELGQQGLIKSINRVVL